MSAPADDVGMTEMPTAAQQDAHPMPNATAPGRAATPSEQPQAHHSGLSIIGSKIGPAAPGRAILPRPRLVDWLLNQGRARLVLVSAEAGYGKTTLLNEFTLQTRDTCVWYRMESSDGDWITFLSYLVAAFRDVWPGFGRSTEALLRNVAAMGSTREVVLAQFLSDLSEVDDRRVAVILDDYHFVDSSTDIRMILSRLLELAPAGMYFILGGRGAPNLSLGRLTAQGRVSELTIDELRFTLDEVEHLFTTTYGQPLDSATCRMIAEKTDGWAASLQLVAASIAVRRPAEIAGFIDALSGSTGPIYDFLAEEVLTRLSPETQQILMHASLVVRLRPEYVAVALAANEATDSVQAVDAALDEAEALGLVNDRGRAAGGRRMHPLFREFLEVHLQQAASDERLREMHRAIAREAEAGDWLMAAEHYARGGEDVEAMRVLGSAASEALGTGAWGTAVAILELLPETAAPAAVKVIQARALISDEDLRGALRLLSDIDRSDMTPAERGLVGLTSAAVYHMTGDRNRLNAAVEAAATDTELPTTLHEIALSWRHLLNAADGGCISDAVQALRRIASNQAKANLHYFAGITLHNTATAELARGNYEQVRELAQDSISHLERTDVFGSITASTRSLMALALAEMGQIEEALRLANLVASEPGATADSMAEAAHLHAVCGRTQHARALVARFERGEAPWASDPTSMAVGCLARAAIAMAGREYRVATREVRELSRIRPVDFDAPSRLAVLEALLALAQRSDDAVRLAQHAVAVCTRQNAWRWAARARILEAASLRDGESLALWIAEAESDSAVAILEVADGVAAAIGTLAPLPEALERSVLREPARWVSALSGQLHQPPSEDARAAASLIARFGTEESVPLLREFDRANGSKRNRRGVASELVRRVSPVVRVHDLGLSSYEVGGRRVPLTETRRKPASLLLYLVTCISLGAAREQVMESLWPDQSPKSALNSLHQTIFHLRRDIEPWFEEGVTADYLHLEGEMVWLDGDLFQIDSVAFARQAGGILASGSAVTRGPELLRLYRGHFAPEFEYEEWAVEWRSHLHTTYLHLAHATSRALVDEHRFGEAVEVLSPVVALDPTAFDMSATFVACLAATGATDAAHAHYRSLAASHERELGLPARSYKEILTTVPKRN